MAVDVVMVMPVIVLIVMRRDGFVVEPALHLDAFGLRVEQAEPEQQARIDRAMRGRELRRTGVERPQPRP